MNRCEKCQMTFRRGNYLRKHLQRKIPCDRQIFCPRCYKGFNKFSLLVSHLQKKNICIICNDNPFLNCESHEGEKEKMSIWKTFKRILHRQKKNRLKNKRFRPRKYIRVF